MERVVSVVGYAAMLLLAWGMSSHKHRFPWRMVITGTLLQTCLALFMLRTSVGQALFGAIGDGVTALLGFVDAGSLFVFGEAYQEHYFAFRILPTIIFVSAIMSVLYYLRIMQGVVWAMAWVMQRTMNLSGAESLAAAANVFVGQTEAPLVIRPYVETMTRSELMALMVGGFATISGGVLAAFVGMGIDAGHLLTASVISAPAGMMIAKILQPEVEEPLTRGTVRTSVAIEARNVIEAAAQGTTEGLKLALNVGAMLLVFFALIAMCNALLGQLGAWCGQTWSLELLLGYLFWPLAWLMGIETSQCQAAGELLGLKMVATEFVAYERLAAWKQQGTPHVLTERTVVIMSYALCGFSNFGSIGVQLGGIGELAPRRRGELAELGLRAMLGGTLACCMTGCVAGLLMENTTLPATAETALVANP
jgi:CNT family concentrative nucleoside transporter